MSRKGRTFTELKESKTQEELQDLSEKVATIYATTVDISYKYFVQEFNISKSCFYKLLEFAVERNLVDDEIVDKMIVKAIKNQRRHCETAGENTILHYKRLKRKREEYILSTYSEDTKIEIANDYALNIEMSIGDIAHFYSINELLVKKVLRETFIENKVSDEICKKMEERSIKDSSNKAVTKQGFEKLWNERENHKEKSS